MLCYQEAKRYRAAAEEDAPKSNLNCSKDLICNQSGGVNDSGFIAHFSLPFPKHNASAATTLDTRGGTSKLSNLSRSLLNN